jgi:hypothetical protein
MEKHINVSEICGLFLCLDNEKIIHNERKLHMGYLKIRQYLNILKTRKFDRNMIREDEIELI